MIALCEDKSVSIYCFVFRETLRNNSVGVYKKKNAWGVVSNKFQSTTPTLISIRETFVLNAPAKVRVRLSYEKGSRGVLSPTSFLSTGHTVPSTQVWGGKNVSYLTSFHFSGRKRQ